MPLQNSFRVYKLKERWKVLLVLLIVFLIAFGFRMIGVGDVMTVDEERWMLRSGEFWHKVIRNGDVGGTFVTTHPGATLNWVAGAGIVVQEGRLGFDIDTSNLRYFRRAAQLPVVLVVSLLVAWMTWLMGQLFSWRVAWWAGLLVAVEPYFIGMSQVVHVDMLLALFMTSSILSFVLYLEDARKRWLVISGVSMGLAFATKLFPALWLPGFMGLVVLLSRQRKLLLRRFLFIVGLGIFVFYLVWPALWVKSGLEDYYQRDVVAVATVDHGLSFETKDPKSPASFYVRSVLGRVSPFSLLVGLGMLITLVRYDVATRIFKHMVGVLVSHDGREKKGELVSARALRVLVWYGLGFLIGISFAAKKADRYALPAMMMLPLLAGLGWGLVLAHWPCNGRMACRLIYPFLVPMVLFALLLQPVGYMSHGLAYASFLGNYYERPFTQQGWGEGLEAAAQWLNERDVQNLTVASWYPGVLRTYFNGTTMSLSSRHDDRVGYVVLYRNMLGRAPDDVASNVLDEFREREPVHTVFIGGQPYVWIYEQFGLPYFSEHIGELKGAVEVGQVITMERDAIDHIDIGISTFSGRQNTQDVVLHVRESIEATKDLRTVRINASELLDSEWHRFDFERLDGLQGKELYFALTSEESVSGDAVTVRFSKDDVREGEMVLLRRALKDGEAKRDFIRSNDMAYRL